MTVSRRALLTALVLASCSDPSSPPPESGLPPGPNVPGIHVVSGESVTDTALALAPRPLVVRVRGPDGEPLAGVDLQARGLAHDTVLSRVSMVVAPAFTDAGYSSQVSTTSDANGYAQFAVRLGGLAGNGAIEIRATTAEVADLPRDTARFTIRAGRPRQLLLAPRDTALYVGGVARPRVRVADLNGNVVSDAPAPTFEAASPSLSVDAAGAATGVAVGRSWVRVRTAGITDSVGVSIVPQGTIAVHNTRSVNSPFESHGDVLVLNLDGSDIRTVIAKELFYGGGKIPDWHPTGTQILLDSGPDAERLYTYTIGGAPQRVMAAANGLTEEFRGQYSKDGWIYFVGRATIGVDIYRVRADGTGLSRMRDPAVTGAETSPDPSPDGTRVAVMSDYRPGCGSCGTFDFSIRVYDVATGTSKPVGLPGQFPRWSPAGDVIAFLDPRGAIVAVRPDGSGRRIVSTGGQRYESPLDWSPDGRWIVARTFGGAMLHLIEVETSMTLPLPFSAGLNNPAWRP